MGILYETIKRPDRHRYEREMNADGTEKHITCHGARFHVLSWDSKGARCSEPNCELNRLRG